jgi:hypothetical protein
VPRTALVAGMSRVALGAALALERSGAQPLALQALLAAAALLAAPSGPPLFATETVNPWGGPATAPTSTTAAVVGTAATDAAVCAAGPGVAALQQAFARLLAVALLPALPAAGAAGAPHGRQFGGRVGGTAVSGQPAAPDSYGSLAFLSQASEGMRRLFDDGCV